jgi:hypothetical protein
MRSFETAAARWPETRNRCVSCGFLGKHRFSWFEVTLEERALGSLAKANAEPRVVPGCIRGVADLARERDGNLAALRENGEPVADAEGNVNVRAERQALLEVLNLDRRCSDWYPYTPGFSPKEHLEELRMAQLEQERRDHELALAQLRRDSDERGDKIAESLRQVTVETAKFTTKWTYFAFGVAVLGVALVAAAYFFPDFGRQVGDVIRRSLAPTPIP